MAQGVERQRERAPREG